MPRYRRNYQAGGTFFFTAVTLNRRPLFQNETCRTILGHSIRSVQERLPLVVEAIVLLPDHIHTIWTLPAEDNAYSLRWKLIKEGFTREMILRNQMSAGTKYWQPRFWEHTIRGDDDFQRCFDYIHWNPVKHGLVDRVRDYPWSSFHRYVSCQWYDLGWGAEEPAIEIAGAEWD